MSGQAAAPLRDDAPLCVGLEAGLLPNGPDAEMTVARWRRSRRVGSDVADEGAAGDAARARLLPYREGVLDALRTARLGGRRTVLVSRGPAGPATAVAEHLQLFDEVLAGQSSRDELARALVDRLGEGTFEFLGGRRAWAWLDSIAKEVRLPPTPGEPARWRSVIRALRVHQWLKNLLVFLPVLAGQRLTDGGTLIAAVVAFVSFCLVASAVYVANDVLDLVEDRSHPSKRRRPFASGALPLSAAPWLALVTLGSGVLMAFVFLPRVFLLTLGSYVVLTSAYTVRLKGAVLIDVLTLAGLYALRVLAGSAATGITPSVWLLGFSLFFFLSLAMLKRYAELHSVLVAEGDPPGGRLAGRSYQTRDLPVLIALGVGTGCMAVLVLALYVISDEFAAHYRHPWLLWQLCPLALYWVGRAWMVVARDEMTDDPVIWALRDRLSRWTGALAILILLLAR